MNARNVDDRKAPGIKRMLTADILIALSAIFVPLWLWIVTP